MYHYDQAAWYVSELSIGENIILDKEDHITICKPRDRDSTLYKSIVSTIRNAINGYQLTNTNSSTNAVEKTLIPNPVV